MSARALSLSLFPSYKVHFLYLKGDWKEQFLRILTSVGSHDLEVSVCPARLVRISLLAPAFAWEPFVLLSFYLKSYHRGWVRLNSFSLLSAQRWAVTSGESHDQVTDSNLRWHVTPFGSNIYLTLFSVLFSVEPMSSTDHSTNCDIVFVGGTVLWNFVRVIVVLRLTI